MAKYYFRKKDETCYEIESHLDYMQEHNISKLDVFEAKRECGTGYFFCKQNNEIGVVNESCGNCCNDYKPNNGKNGRCKHYGHVYEMTDVKRTLELELI